MTEKECREAWNKHQTKCQLGKESYQLEDMMDYMDFRSAMGVKDEEDEYEPENENFLNY